MKSIKKISTAFLKQTQNFNKLSEEVIMIIQNKLDLKIQKGEEIPGGAKWVFFNTDHSLQVSLEIYYDGIVHLLLNEVRQGGNSSYLIPTTEKPHVFNLIEEDSIVKIIVTLKNFKLK
jgi:hypothetical protein